MSGRQCVIKPFSHFGFALRCVELRGLAAKIPQTVEATVKTEALARAREVTRKDAEMR
jgi:hypothetical protein